MNASNPADVNPLQAPEQSALSEVDQNILDEINGCMHQAVDGFFEKYFENKSWSPSVERCAQAATQELSLSSVLELLLESPSTSLGGRSIFQSSTSKPPSESATQHASNLFLVPEDFAFIGNSGWADVQVVGHFRKDTEGDYLRGFLYLYENAREVLSQSARLFLHGFYIYGSMVELWMFDRSGLYSCQPFDATVDPSRLMTIIAGYMWMSDRELGINTRIEKDESGKYIMLQGGDELQVSKLYLVDEPIAFPRRIVSQATTCYKGKMPGSMTWDLVLKFSWRSNERTQEETMLELVKDRKVWGVVQLFSHQQLNTISNLRKDIGFGAHREFPLTDTASMEQLRTISEKRDQYRPAEGSIPPFEDRIFSCLVVTPLGYPLDKFRTILEFLEGCRDAIKGHRSLYLDGNILHQDVSKDNIIIPETKKPGELRGILIDLDLAMDLTVGPQKPGELIGTKAFMAIEVLSRKSHTYRHDLESFLYVFLWIAICGGHKRLPAQSRLQLWLRGSWDILARNKAEDMEEEGFSIILSEFSPLFKGLEGLAWALREVLFLPSPNGSLFTGTRHEPEEVQRLYEEMIAAFDVAIYSHTQRTSGAGEV